MVSTVSQTWICLPGASLLSSILPSCGPGKSYPLICASLPAPLSNWSHSQKAEKALLIGNCFPFYFPLFPSSLFNLGTDVDRVLKVEGKLNAERMGKGIYGTLGHGVVWPLSEKLAVWELEFQGPGSGMFSRPFYFSFKDMT